MPITFKTDSRGSYLYIKGEGGYSSFQDLKKNIDALLIEANKKSCSRILLDQRNITVNVDAFDLIKFADYLDSISIQSSGFRIVALPNPDFIDKFNAFQTAANNRSFAYRLFKSETKAVDWLVSTKA